MTVSPCRKKTSSACEKKPNVCFIVETMPFIDRLFNKINNSNEVPAAVPTSTTTDRFDLSDEEDDDRNFKHRRQRSPEEQDRGNNKRRLQDDNNNNAGSSKYYRSSEDNRRPGYNNNGYDNRGGRGGYNNRGGRGGRGGGNNMNRSRPQCRDYNGRSGMMKRYLN